MTRGHVNVEILPLYLGPRSRYWLALFTILLSIELLRGAVHSLHAVLVSGMVGRLALEHGLARAVCGFPIFRCRSVSGCSVLQYIAELLCLVTGRAPPFGMKPKEDAEEFARAQAKQALGDVP